MGSPVRRRGYGRNAKGPSPIEGGHTGSVGSVEGNRKGCPYGAMGEMGFGGGDKLLAIGWFWGDNAASYERTFAKLRFDMFLEKKKRKTFYDKGAAFFLLCGRVVGFLCLISQGKDSG